MTMRFLFLALLAFLTLVPASASAADPAVAYANKVRTGDIAYSEGYFGEGGNRLHYVEAGKGPLVILYHGFPSFWYSWFDQMEMLKTRYRVVAVDGLGAGLSAKPENLQAYRVERLAAQIDALARHLDGKKRFTLIGHDWGAALAFAYAQANPKRLNAVIGMSAPPYNLFLDLVRSNAAQQKRSTYMQLFRSVTLDDIGKRNLPETMWKQSYGSLVSRGDLSVEESELFRIALSDPKAIDGGMNWYRANIPPVADIGAADFWPRGNNPIQLPALLLWGEADGTFVPEFIDRMPDYAKRIEIVRLPGINHWTPMEKPAEANRAISAFLAKHGKRKSP